MGDPDAQPTRGLASVVHVLRQNLFPLINLSDLQAIFQTCRATRALLATGNDELQRMLRVRNCVRVQTRCRCCWSGC